MGETAVRVLRVVRGNNVHDHHGCTFGVLDFNPDLSDPAVALAVADPDGEQVDRPVCRTGRELSCGEGQWRATAVHTDGRVYVELQELDATPESSA